MPVTEVVLEDLFLLGLESLAETEPATANGTAHITNATFLGKLAGDVLIGVALLLEVHDAGIIGVVVGLDRLRACGLATEDTDVALVRELVANMGGRLEVVLLEKAGSASWGLEQRKLRRRASRDALLTLSFARLTTESVVKIVSIGQE